MLITLQLLVNMLHEEEAHWWKSLSMKMDRLLTGIIFVVILGNVHSEISLEVEDNASCNCVLLTECNQLHDLAIAENFDELRNNFKICGFERKVPKFCCPSESINVPTILKNDPLNATIELPGVIEGESLMSVWSKLLK